MNHRFMINQFQIKKINILLMVLQNSQIREVCFCNALICKRYLLGTIGKIEVLQHPPIFNRSG